MKNILFIILISIILSNCSKKIELDYKNINQPSYAKPKKAIIKNITLRLKIYHIEKKIKGMVALKIRNYNSEEIILDTKNISIDKILIGKDLDKTPYLHDFKDSIKGRPLYIKIKKNTINIRVYYTINQSSALQWYSDAKNDTILSFRKNKFSARNLMPIQDLQEIKFPFYASIEVDKKLKVLMNGFKIPEKNNLGVYNFKSKNKISPNDINFIITK